MIKKIVFGLIFITTLLATLKLHAQSSVINNKRHYKIGIFAPLYLDSIFNNNVYKYSQNLPRFIAPAVDFVNGAQLALDSLGKGDDFIDAYIFDTKSYTEKVPELINNKKLDSLELIIGSVKDAEYLQLAAFALQKNIPFISVTYPNDAGITGNPFLVIVNSTLKSHCDAIYSYLLQQHSTDKIFLCRKKGKQEDMVAAHFKAANMQEDGKYLLPIETLEFDDNFNTTVFKAKLDSNRKNIIIGASLDETFASKLAKASLELNKTYPITLIGMPNWDNFSFVYDKKKMADFPIYYTSPYYNNKADSFSIALTNAYSLKYKSTKPGDMVFKGYEAVYMFTKLLIKDPNNFMNLLNDKGVKVFCDYNFKPVNLHTPNSIPDYFENKHLYFIKILNGSVSKAW